MKIPRNRQVTKRWCGGVKKVCYSHHLTFISRIHVVGKCFITRFHGQCLCLSEPWSRDWKRKKRWKRWKSLSASNNQVSPSFLPQRPTWERTFQPLADTHQFNSISLGRGWQSRQEQTLARHTGIQSPANPMSALDYLFKGRMCEENTLYSPYARTDSYWSDLIQAKAFWGKKNVYIHGQECTHIWRTEVNPSTFLHCSLPQFWGGVSYWSGAGLPGLTGWLASSRDSPVFLSRTETTNTDTTVPGISYLGFGNWNQVFIFIW